MAIETATDRPKDDKGGPLPKFHLRRVYRGSRKIAMAPGSSLRDCETNVGEQYRVERGLIHPDSVYEYEMMIARMNQRTRVKMRAKMEARMMVMTMTTMTLELDRHELRTPISLEWMISTMENLRDSCRTTKPSIACLDLRGVSASIKRRNMTCSGNVQAGQKQRFFQGCIKVSVPVVPAVTGIYPMSLNSRILYS